MNIVNAGAVRVRRAHFGPRAPVAAMVAALVLTLTALAGRARPGTALVSGDAAIVDSRAARYGVIVGGGDPEQVRTLGLSWYARCCDADMTPPDGLQVPRFLPIDPPIDEEQVRALVARFPGAVWMIGNEPNVADSSPPGYGNLTPDAYATVLHGYAGTIRAADPTARLAGPNVLNWDFVCVGCPGYPQGLAWTEAMRAAYADRYGDQPPLDIWTIHLYELDWVHFPNGNAAMNIDQLQGMRRWLDAFDDLRDRPMWLTEVGIHWGFPGLAWENGVAVPVGEFAYDHVETYLRELFGWLNDHAESMHIDRWFLWTASAQHGEGFESQYAGITLMDGLDADAPIGRLGRVYQELAGVR